MAVTITQQPTEWNLAYVPNVYVLSGLGSAERFVVNVQINGSYVATIRQPENPAGVAIFDISKVLQAYLQPTFIEETQLAAPSTTEMLTYRIQYGSETAGIVTYTGLSAVRYALNGYDNWRTLNWDNSPFRSSITEEECENLNPYGTFTKKSFLTNFPQDYSIRRNEYHTLSFFNQLQNFTIAHPNTQPYFVQFNFHNSAGAILYSHIYTLDDTNGLGPRTDCNDTGSYTYATGEQIGHIGAGVQNLKDAGIWLGIYENAVAYYTVKLYSLNECYYFDNGPISDCGDISELADYLGLPMYEATFNVEEACTPFEPIRVSFMNQYGVRDYYTFDRRNTYTVQTDRNNYAQVPGSWSSSTFSISNTDRGTRVFSSAINETMLLSTNWMTDAESEWMQELYTSPHILIYKEGQWEPAVITSNTYEEKTYNRNRMFQHFLTIEYSNRKTVQRG